MNNSLFDSRSLPFIAIYYNRISLFPWTCFSSSCREHFHISYKFVNHIISCIFLVRWLNIIMHSVQFSSVAQLCWTLCDPMNCSRPGLPVHYHLPEFTQTHVHWVSDAIQPSHPLSFPSPPASNPSQHQSLFQWVNSSHEVAKVLDQLTPWQISYYWIPGTQTVWD